MLVNINLTVVDFEINMEEVPSIFRKIDFFAELSGFCSVESAQN
jgi:hypothetical protein